jgi:hypothetical protein
MIDGPRCEIAHALYVETVLIRSPHHLKTESL